MPVSPSCPNGGCGTRKDACVTGHRSGKDKNSVWSLAKDVLTGDLSGSDHHGSILDEVKNQKPSETWGRAGRGVKEGKNPRKGHKEIGVAPFLWVKITCGSGSFDRVGRAGSCQLQVCQQKKNTAHRLGRTQQRALLKPTLPRNQGKDTRRKFSSPEIRILGQSCPGSLPRIENGRITDRRFASREQTPALLLMPTPLCLGAGG